MEFKIHINAWSVDCMACWDPEWNTIETTNLAKICQQACLGRTQSWSTFCCVHEGIMIFFFQMKHSQCGHSQIRGDTCQNNRYHQASGHPWNQSPVFLAALVLNVDSETIKYLKCSLANKSACRSFTCISVCTRTHRPLDHRQCVCPQRSFFQNPNSFQGNSAKAKCTYLCFQVLLLSRGALEWWSQSLYSKC